MTPEPAVLRVVDMDAGYGQAAVVRGLNLTVGPGEIVALLGRNGAGKTTTLISVAGVLTPMAGEIWFDGQPSRGPLHKRARAGLALITETRAIVRRLTVMENLRLGRGQPEEGLDLFPELKPLTRREAGLLSGGEQQMLVLARVLAARPKLLLVDELSLGLAPLIVQRLLAALRAAATANQSGVLLVEQHPVAALSVADRGYVMAGGQIRMSDTSKALQSRLPEIEAAYLSGPAVNESLGNDKSDEEQ